MANEALDSYSIEIDDLGGGVEPHYFTILKLMRLRGYDVSKAKDVFASSEMSSFWGDMSRRRGEQETRAMQLMGTLNGMVKDLFKVMRTISIIEERLTFYERSKKGDEAADSTLKDIWVTLVEGGTKNPSSVLGLATQVGFVALPDYFYTTQVKKVDEIDGVIDKLDVSKKLSYVLKRKLSQFVVWRERTGHELKVRRKFLKGMLKAHISQVRLYAEWLKPYSRAIQRLRNIREEKPELVTAFETAWLEVVLEGVKKDEAFGKYFPVVKVTFTQTTSPGEAYQSSYQKGYVHRGKTEIKMTAHVYTDDEWKKEKENDDAELIDFLIDNIDEAIKSMKDDMIKLLQEDYDSLLSEKKKDKKERKKPQEKIQGFVTAIFPFFGFLFKKRDVGGLKDVLKFQEKFDDTLQKEKASETVAGKEDVIQTDLGGDLWKIYDLFKKTRGMARP